MKQIITISRQYGSGGREIGQALAEHYHIPFYDKNVAELSAAVTGFTTKVIENLEDSVPSILSYQYYGFPCRCRTRCSLRKARSSARWPTPGRASS